LTTCTEPAPRSPLRGRLFVGGSVGAGCAECVADPHILDFGHGTDPAGGEIGDVVMLLALELEQVVEPDPAPTGDLDLLVGLDRPREDAKQ